MAERDSVYRYNAEAYGANAAPQPKAPVKPEKPEEQPPITMKRTEVKSGSLFNIILVSALAFVMLGTSRTMLRMNSE